MKWQKIAKILGTGGVGVVALITAIFMLTGIDYEFTGDTVCEGLDCEVFINVTTDYWRICFENTKPTQTIYQPGVYSLEKSTAQESNFPVLYKKSTRGRTLWVNLDKVDNIVTSNPNVQVEWYFPTYGNKWRPIKSGDCWDRRKVNKNKLVFKPTEGMKIKWSFVLGDKVDIDPLLTSYNYLYENLSKRIPVYETIEVKATYNSTSKSIEAAHNISKFKDITYRTEYEVGKRIGVNFGGNIYSGYVNVDKGKLYQWKYPIGDRNFEEFGACRQYEIEKGVCNEIK